MASAKKFRSEGITVVNRIRILRAKLEALERPDRTRIKKEMEFAIQPFTNEALRDLKLATPESPESAETMAFREKGWSKYGIQDYVLQRSDLKSERYWGISLKNGWAPPVVDFTGSGKNIIGFNVRFANIAPQARLVLLGEYNKSSWDIPKENMHGGRRVMMWQRSDGSYGFRWDTQGPLTQRAPRPLTRILEEAEVEMERSRPAMIKAIQDALVEEFRTL
jgi:hypothetical protein